MTTNTLFNEREASALVQHFQNQDFHQYSYSIIHKTLKAKNYDKHESLVVNALMVMMNNVLEDFKNLEADSSSILLLSEGLYNLLLQVECVEAVPAEC